MNGKGIIDGLHVSAVGNLINSNLKVILRQVNDRVAGNAHVR